MLSTSTRARPRRRAGFTLTEILIVVGVVTVLLGIALPVLSGVYDRGRITQSLNTVRQLGLFTTQHQLDHDGRLLLESDHSRGFGNPSWEIVYCRFVTGVDILDLEGAEQRDTLARFVNEHLRCPFDLRTSTYPSYGVNVYPELTEAETGDRTWGWLSQFRSPARTVHFGELEDESTTDHLMAHFWTDDPRSVEVAVDRGPPDEVYGFFDGHVEHLPFDRTFAVAEADGDIARNLWNPATAR